MPKMTMKDVMKLPAGKQRMEALKRFKQQQAAAKKDVRTVEELGKPRGSEVVSTPTAKSPNDKTDEYIKKIKAERPEYFKKKK